MLNRTASSNAAVPKARSSMRVQVPTSAQAAMQVDMKIAKLDFAPRNLDAAMRAAQ